MKWSLILLAALLFVVATVVWHFSPFRISHDTGPHWQQADLPAVDDSMIASCTRTYRLGEGSQTRTEIDAFCLPWLQHHFGRLSDRLYLVLEGVERKKKGARAASDWYDRWGKNAAWLIAIVGALASISVAVSQSAHSLRIPRTNQDAKKVAAIAAILFSAIVTAAASMTGYYGFNDGLIENERTEALFAKLETEIHSELLRAVEAGVDLEVMRGKTDAWTARLDELSSSWVEVYLSRVGDRSS